MTARDARPVVALLLTVVACGDVAPTPTTMTIDTLPGGAIRVSNTGPLWTPETAWTLVEDLRLGTVDDSRPGEQFADIASILTDAGGRIYLLERQAQEIRVFDAAGEFSHRIGRAGEGPGELLRADGMTWGPDGRLWVVDSRRGYAVFERDSTFVTQHPRRVLGVPRPWPGAFADDGLLYDWVTDAIERELSVRPALASGAADVEFRNEGYLYPIRVSDDFETVDTLPRLEYLSGHVVGVPFGDGLSVFPDRAGLVWFARNREYSIHRRTLAGDTLRVFGIPATAAPVSAAERDSVLDLSADRPAILRIDPEDIPTTKPVVRALFGDSGGHLYVVPEVLGVEPGTVVDVFREDGAYLGRLALPRPILLSGPRPHATRDHLYVVVTDELDVPYVQRLRIVRPD